MAIKAVTLDFGGTLVEGKLDEEAYRVGLISYLHCLGHKTSEASLKKAVGGTLDRLNKVRKNNREIKFEEFYACVLRRLEIQPDEDVLNRVYRLYLQSFSSKVVLGANAVLQSLKVGYKLAIVSNAMSEVSRHTLNVSGLNSFFQVVVLSRDIGIRKPDPRIFWYTLKKIKVSAVNALHVGDSMEQDVIGAKRAGMKTVWIKGEEKVIEEPDCVINSISELPKAIELIEKLM